MDIGEQIKELREKKNIVLEELALGVCTVECLRKIEQGKEMVNKLFMEIMFQRLGKSTDKLELIVSEKVYEEEERKEYFEECLERGDGKQAATVLELWKKEATEDCNVRKMFFYRSMAYAELRIGQNPEKAKEWMQKALDITMPGWQECPLEEYWISTIEMENLLAYAKTQLAIGTESELKGAEQLLLACQQFIDGRISDGEEHAKIFAKCAHLLAGLYVRQGNMIKAEQLAKRALQELQDYGISYFMEPILEILVQCTKYKVQKKTPYQEYLSALRHVKQYVGIEWYFTDSIFKNCSQQTYYIDHELFREERIAQGYSQEQVIEGVFKNPESLSRAEKGVATMRNSKLNRLFRKLGIEKSRYNGFVVTDKYEVLELKQKVDILISRNCYKEAEEKIEELGSKLDLTVAENRRWIQGYHITVGIEDDNISKERLLEQAIELLQETYRLHTHGVYRPPMDREAALLNQIGILLYELNRKEEAIQLFYSITEAMRNSKVSVRKRSRKYSLLRTNLAKWEYSIPMAKENLCFTLSCGKLRTLPVDYMTIACAMIDNPANWEICREMIKDSYFLCKLVQNDINQKITKQYYKERFEEDL